MTTIEASSYLQSAKNHDMTIEKYLDACLHSMNMQNGRTRTT